MTNLSVNINKVATVRNARGGNNPDLLRVAKDLEAFGAQGIGLCRTEHMFFDPSRIGAFREMICADTVEEREAALNKILPMQQWKS